MKVKFYSCSFSNLRSVAVQAMTRYVSGKISMLDSIYTFFVHSLVKYFFVFYYPQVLSYEFVEKKYRIATYLN